MAHDDKLEIAGGVWDSLSTGKKWGLTFGAVTVLIAVFGAGYWLANTIAEQKIATLDAKHAREVNELQSKSAPEYEWRFAVVPDGPHDLPKLADAKPNDLNIAEYAKLFADFKSSISEKTSINRASFGEFVGQRFTWTGYVSDVREFGSKDDPSFTVSMSAVPDRKWDSFSVDCNFAGEAYEEMVKGLTRKQEVTVTGVLSSEAALRFCKFVKIGPLPME
jgi:hypothetical protein